MSTSDAATAGTVEVVRGRLSEERAGQLMAFWERTGALDEETARERLGQVVCVLLDEAGEVAGVNSVYPAPVHAVGGRVLWIYRSLLLPEAGEAWAWMLHTAISALEAEFDPTVAGPQGVCVLVADRDEMARRPEAKWLYPRMLYAGYLDDGRQVRVRWFLGARVSGPRPFLGFAPTLDPGYRIEPFAEQDAVGPDDIVDLWTREGAMSAEEARRRVDEVLLVAARKDDPAPVAVCTAFIAHSDQLRMDLWHFRVFVAAAHRISYAAWALAMVAQDYLQHRFVSNRDERAAGAVFEVEHPGLKERFDEAVWIPLDFAFIGENERGDHVRVHFFPGALAPLPA
jgi:hypothetical protein